MLGPGRYLLGVAEIALLTGFAGLGATRLRSLLLPDFEGAPAHLATTVLALALLIWPAELLGSFGALDPLPYLALVSALGLGLLTLLPRVAWGGGGVPPRGVCEGQDPVPDTASVPLPRADRSAREATPTPRQDPPAGASLVPTLIALAVAVMAFVHFAAGAKMRLSTGMTGFDSTWYHGPFAAGFFQSGDTWDLHFIAPQFLAWFYPANGEIFHAAGMLAFGRDLLSPLLNLGWFAGCLLACWCIGRPYRVAPWSLAMGAIALSVPALADQAGEARNDVVGVFFLLAAVAIALNARVGGADPGPAAAQESAAPGRAGEEIAPGRQGLPPGALAVVGLAAGLAAGTKLNFLLPCAVLVLGLALVAPRGGRWRALVIAGLAALAGGGYWYLRNLAHAGNPLPWAHRLGPISLPAPTQALGGREAHSVLGYLTDGSVWSDWFLPGLHHGLWLAWPILAAAALAGLVLCLDPRSQRFRGSKATDDVEMEPRNRDQGFHGSKSTDAVDLEPWNRAEAGRGPVLMLAGLVGLATAFAWLVAPTSASGPEGMPRGFESGLRYLTPALVLGLALLPATRPLRSRLARFLGALSSFAPDGGRKDDGAPRSVHRRRWAVALGLVLLAAIVAVGYPVQRHYLKSRYSDPTFTTPGLDAAFAWADDVSGARIATTSTRQYPLLGTDLSNRVQFVGRETAHGGFEALASCRAWRRALDAGHFDYAVATYDRLEPGNPPYPPQARWTEGPGATAILKKPPTAVFKLHGKLDPSACPPG